MTLIDNNMKVYGLFIVVTVKAKLSHSLTCYLVSDPISPLSTRDNNGTEEWTGRQRSPTSRQLHTPLSC